MKKARFALVLGAFYALPLSACESDVEDVACATDTDLICGGEVRRSTLDTGEAFELDPGVGVGVFAEYDGEGRYRISTTCDSRRTGYACYFDILVGVPQGATIVSIEGESLEDDVLEQLDDTTVSFRSVTDYDTDGFVLITEPGTVISLDTLLDCSCGNRYVYWIGDGAIHSGAPSNPIEFEPSTP